MSLAKGEVVEADPENWLISEGKLYIFGNARDRSCFGRTSPGIIAQANQNRPLIEKR